MGPASSLRSSAGEAEPPFTTSPLPTTEGDGTTDRRNTIHPPDPADVAEALRALDVLEQKSSQHLPADDLRTVQLRLRNVRDLLHDLNTNPKEITK